MVFYDIAPSKVSLFFLFMIDWLVPFSGAKNSKTFYTSALLAQTN
jgi:hypothetical protein